MEKKQRTPMEKLTEGYEEFMKDKNANISKKKDFDEILRQAVQGEEANKSSDKVKNTGNKQRKPK